MPRRAHDYRGLTQPRRLQLLRAIQRAPGRRAGELASECGIPLNTVRDHLRVLEDEGLIRGETVQVGMRGRPPVVFHPVREAALSPAASARVHGADERGRMLRAVTRPPTAVRAADTALDADAVRQLDVLYEHLDDAGLDPAVDEGSLSFDLAPCRYHDMIDEDRALVCRVHARLVRDVLAQTDGPLAVERLEPFVTAHRCRLQLMLVSRKSSP
ncbi:helix-turn-helix domain-containing protein [Microbacterium jejuense]|uniref:helix-turn-helix domain-containing protein n=1 Tax=Microbacterium jejuense TaxID=1263637 RepID=UPI0031F0A2B3